MKNDTGKCPLLSSINLLLFVLIPLCITGCGQSYGPPDLQRLSGMGSLSLRIGNGTARTILPNTEPANLSYTLDFYKAGTTELAHTEDRPYSALSDNIYLKAGTYSVHITAWITDKAKQVAQGSADEPVEIIAGRNTACTVTLTAFGFVSGGRGTFSWNITLPNGITAAAMKIEPVSNGGTAEQIKNLSDNRTGSLDLAAGCYQITFTLTKPDYQPVIWLETLHLYQNMVSHFKHEFFDADFNINKYTITYFYNDGITANVKQTRAYGAAATEPGNPGRMGYTFGGWFTDNGNKWNFDTRIDRDLFLYAKWMYTLRLKIDGLAANDTVSFSATESVIETAAASDTVSVYYTLTTGDYATDELRFSFQSTEAKVITDHGTDIYTYTINPNDALNGIITITIQSVHTSRDVLDVPTIDSFTKDGKITFTPGANNITAGSTYTYTLYKDGAAVNENDFTDKTITSGKPLLTWQPGCYQKKALTR